ncbi:probable disease resistance protein At5g63020 [Arachis stenosperma]|uniref:probable disease resistance protein At5g63020 n=1 Tax=Arachis stenosperma TaxID=217475 RepID=UPI0025ABD547|nr:probable disease resistance protein At5g63020 [Arachis stenosperma]
MEQAVGILWDAGNRLYSCIKVHADYIVKQEENLTKLKEKMEHLDNICRDVVIRIENDEIHGERRRRHEVNGWLQQVRNLQQEMEETKDLPEPNKKCLICCGQSNCVSRYKFGKRVHKMIFKVNEVLSKGEGYTHSVDITHHLSLKPIYEIPHIETVGVDSMVDRVWNSLQDENVGIIGIYGMGGVGKTTLMKRIHNEFGNRNHEFDLVLWITIAKDCDNAKVMNDIRNRLGVKDDSWNRSSEHEKVGKIYQVLRQRRFVLMLDDLWGKLELQEVGVPNPKKAGCRSKVVFTTREEDVCDKMQADKKFKMEVLSEEDSFALFCKKVGEGTIKSNVEIPRQAKKMAKECKGLPLALVIVGSAMSGVRSIDSWRQAKHELRRNPWIASDLEKNVFGVLKFSYDRLPDEAHKNCFLYCAVYPEDYEIKVEDVIDRWIGEGFLGRRSKKSIYDMREEGHSIIEKLKLCCLVEDVMADIFQWWPRIKMHDVMRDMALWIACDQDDKVVVEEHAFHLHSQKMELVEKISIIRASGLRQLPPCPNLVTLCLQNLEDDVDFSNLQIMSKLKVLDLSNNRHIRHLPSEIGMVINLEFLNLSLSEVSTQIQLPIELKKLEKLKVLLMKDTFTSSNILEVLESLKQLQILRVGYGGRVGGGMSFSEVDNNQEAILIDKLESLPQLEELCINLKTMRGIQKLLSSTKLQGCLRYVWLSFIDEPIEIATLLASWSKMKHLELITLQYLYNIKEVPSITYTCHLEALRDVEINGCDSITHLTWLKHAQCLEILQVRNCNSIQELVKEDQGETVDMDLFPHLRFLKLSFLVRLKRIYNGVLPFHSLKFIMVVGCDHLRKLPLNFHSKDTLIQITGETEWWNNLVWDDPAIRDALDSRFRPFILI